MLVCTVVVQLSGVGWVSPAAAAGPALPPDPPRHPLHLARARPGVLLPPVPEPPKLLRPEPELLHHLPGLPLIRVQSAHPRQLFLISGFSPSPLRFLLTAPEWARLMTELGRVPVRIYPVPHHGVSGLASAPGKPPSVPPHHRHSQVTKLQNYFQSVLQTVCCDTEPAPLLSTFS